MEDKIRNTINVIRPAIQADGGDIFFKGFDPDTGVVDLQTLRMIRTSRGRMSTPQFGAGFYFGVYAEVVTPGRIHIGDEVTVVD